MGRNTGVAATAALIGSLLLAATASASRVGVDTCLAYCGGPETSIKYFADPGEVNAVTVTVSQDRRVVQIDDPGANISLTETPPQGPYSTKPSHCLVVSPHQALCLMLNAVQGLSTGTIGNGSIGNGLEAAQYGLFASLGDGNDRFRPGAGTEPLDVWVLGGDGNDDLLSGPGPGDHLAGGAGNDVIRSGASTQSTLLGGDGDDRIYANNGVAHDWISCDEYGTTTPGADSVWMDANDDVWTPYGLCDNVTVVP
jgi:Ca2+-binding RTX toxin-like protein